MGRTTWLPWGAGIGGTVGFAAAPVRVLRGSEMVRPSPRRLSPRNKHEIGALSAVSAEGNRSVSPRPYCRQTSERWGRNARCDRRTSKQEVGMTDAFVEAV